MIDFVIVPRSSRSLSDSDWYPSPDPPSLAGSQTLSGGTILRRSLISAGTMFATTLRLTSTAAMAGQIYSSIRFSRPVQFTAWLQKSWERVNELADRPYDWDSYGGLPADPDVCLVVKMFLAGLARNLALGEPLVDGLSDGGLQLEWYRARRHLVLSFRPDLSITAYYYDSVQGDEWAGSMPQDIAEVTNLLAKIAL